MILLLVTFYMIFNFSNQDGEKSGGLSRKVTTIIVEKMLSTSEDVKIETIRKLEPIIRKLAHFSIYTITGILLTSLASTYKIRRIEKIYFSMLIGMLYAITDEIHQAFIPDRAAKLTDVVIDTMGVGVGITVVLTILKQFNKNRKINIKTK